MGHPYSSIPQVLALFLVSTLYFQPCMPLSFQPLPLPLPLPPPSSSSGTSTFSSSFSSAPLTTLDKVTITSSIAKSERRANERLISNHTREVCGGCKRPMSICLCDSLPPSSSQRRIDTTTQILILQHPTEFKRKTISTVPLIPLILSNCQIRVGYQFGEEDILKMEWVQQALERGEKPLLLFPGPDALDLNDLLLDSNSNSNTTINATDDDSFTSSTSSSSSSCPTKLRLSKLLILIDGTWSQAKRTARESPFLLSICQKVQFTTKGNSIYNAIRREPQDHFVSTIECCAQALCLLEPNHHFHFHHQYPYPLGSNNDNDNDNSTMAAKYMIAALTSLVNRQLKIRSQPDRSNPRYLKASDRFQEKHQQRRLELEWELFQSRTNTTNLESSPTKIIPPFIPRKIQRLKDGSTLRPLRHTDAPLINSLIPRCQTTKSLQQIIRQIALLQSTPTNHHTNTASTNPNHHTITANDDKDYHPQHHPHHPYHHHHHHPHPANIGIFRGYELCGCILQYENGVLGMLHVLPEYENRGYGSLLVKTATKLLKRQHQRLQQQPQRQPPLPPNLQEEQDDWYGACYILDGNAISEHLFAKYGWEKANPNAKKRTGRRRAPRLWIKKKR